jgi:hypothetical protein
VESVSGRALDALVGLECSRAMCAAGHQNPQRGQERSRRRAVRWIWDRVAPRRGRRQFSLRRVPGGVDGSVDAREVLEPERFTRMTAHRIDEVIAVAAPRELLGRDRAEHGE